MRDPSLLNTAVTKAMIRRALRLPPKRTPGSPTGGSLWEKIAGFVRLVDPSGSVELETLLRLKTGCELETYQTTGAPITSDQNNYDPGAGFFVDLHPTANRIITGLAGGATGVGATGRWHVLRNAEAWTLTFPNDSASSSNGNRFFCFTTNGKVVLYGGESALVYHTPGLAGSGFWLIWKIVGETVPKPFTEGDLHYVNATPELAILAGNTTTTRKFLRQTGTGAVSAAPAWDTLVDGDIPNVLELSRIGLGAAADGTYALKTSGASIMLASATNGSQWVYGYTTEEIVMAAAAFSSSSANLLPADSVIEAVVGRVTVAIAGAASFTVGDSGLGNSARFIGSTSTAANTTFVGINHYGSSKEANAAAATIRITPNAVPSDANGRVRVFVYFKTFTPPTS